MAHACSDGEAYKMAKDLPSACLLLDVLAIKILVLSISGDCTGQEPALHKFCRGTFSPQRRSSRAALSSPR